MKTINAMLTATAAFMLPSCGGGDEAKKDEAAAAAPATMAAGEYEVSMAVETLASTDATTPFTKLEQGKAAVFKACVAKDGTPAPALFAEPGDKCTATNSYIRNGKANAQLSCTRTGRTGVVMPSFEGKYTADSFEGTTTGLTYFNEKGDYRYSAKLTAKRIGDCPAAPAAG